MKRVYRDPERRMIDRINHANCTRKVPDQRPVLVICAVDGLEPKPDTGRRGDVGEAREALKLADAGTPPMRI